MGIDHHYVNHDKQQHFAASLFNWNARGFELGTGPGGRAFALLLATRGTWHGDHVAVVSDQSDEYEEIYCVYDDVKVNFWNWRPTAELIGTFGLIDAARLACCRYRSGVPRTDHRHRSDFQKQVDSWHLFKGRHAKLPT